MNSFKELPASCRTFILLVCVAGIGVLTYEVPRLHSSEPVGLLLFLILAAVCSPWRVNLTGRLGTISIGFVIVYATLVLFGVPAAVCAGAVSALSGLLISARTKKLQPLHRILFGVATISLTAWLSGHVFTALGGKRVATLEEAPVLLLPVFFSTAIYFLVNTVLVSVPQALSQKQPVFQTWRRVYLWAWTSFYAGTCIAAIMSLSYHYLRYAALIFIIPPLYLFLTAYRLHVEKAQKEAELKEQQLQLKEQQLQHVTALKESADRLSELYLSTVHSLVQAIDAKDRYTRHHSSRVQQYALMVAEQMQLPTEYVEAIRTGGLLHDVGKLGIPDFILSKPGSLTPEELHRIQQHPVLGYEILKPLPFPWEVLPVVRSHHERYDGGGYPDQLSGEEIPLVARVLAVADVYDALTSERPYRKAWSHEKAVEYIRDNAGTQFDPQVVQAFLQVSERVRQVKQDLNPADANGAHGGGDRATNVEIGVRVQGLEHITNAHREVFALYEIAQVMGNALNLDETIHLILQKILHLVGSCCCAIFLVDNHRGELSAYDAVGPHADSVRLLRLSTGEGLTGRVIQQRQLVRSEAAAIDFQGLNVEARPPFRSLISAPLVHNGEVLGALTCYHEQPQAFHDDVVQVLPSCARHAAMALHNALTLDKTRQSAMTDNLTGLPNSRYLFMCLEQEIERAALNLHPLSVIVIDIDLFKNVNDTYGHLAGDQVLKEFGGVLREVGRRYDVVARYAGDEYIIVLPNCDAHSAQAWVERLHQALHKYEWVPRLGHRIPLTASAGIATFPSEVKDIHALIQLADERMYAAKNLKKEELSLAM